MGDVGGDLIGLIGREKFTDPLLSVGELSATLDRPVTGFAAGVCPFAFPVIAPGPRSRLAPLAPVFLGGGELIRRGGSTLAGRRMDLTGKGGGEAYLLGTDGTGGATSALLRDGGRRFGDGSRNVRSVMEPPLFCRCRPGRPAALPMEELEACLCSMRLVWI